MHFDTHPNSLGDSYVVIDNRQHDGIWLLLSFETSQVINTTVNILWIGVLHLLSLSLVN